MFWYDVNINSGVSNTIAWNNIVIICSLELYIIISVGIKLSVILL